MKIIQPVNDKKLDTKSSVYQYSGFLSVRRGDEWVPVVFDTLDGVKCKEMRSHKAMITLEPAIGYHFPVKECRYSDQTYVSSHQDGQEVAKLPDFFGTGFYENHYDREILVNADNGGLGVKNDTTLRVGLDYVLAKKVLDGVA